MNPVLITFGVGLVAVWFVARAIRKPPAQKPASYEAFRNPWVDEVQNEIASPPKPKRSHKRKPR